MHQDLSKKLAAYLQDQLSIGKNLYAILDSAKQPEAAYKPYEFFSEWVSLYKGEPEEVLTDVAPYLINLSKDGKINAPLIQWIAQECWGDSCAIFIESPVNIQNLLEHFQQFLMVTDENGKALYFRFYDPRVLRVYLPTCNAEELDLFFGPVQTFFMEDEEPESLINFRRKEEGIGSENFKL